MMTYRKEGDRNPVVGGRWSWKIQKRKRPISDVRIEGLLHEIKESQRTE